MSYGLFQVTKDQVISQCSFTSRYWTSPCTTATWQLSTILWTRTCHNISRREYTILFSKYRTFHLIHNHMLDIIYWNDHHSWLKIYPLLFYCNNVKLLKLSILVTAAKAICVLQAKQIRSNCSRYWGRYHPSNVWADEFQVTDLHMLCYRLVEIPTIV